MPPVRRAPYLAAGALLISLIAACSGGAPAEPPDDGAEAAQAGDRPAGLTLTADVAFADGVARIQGAAADHLLEARDDGTLVFDGEASGLGDLQRGQVVVVDDLAVRRVTGITRDGERTIVATEDASLGEAITAGTIDWTYAVDWQDLPAATYETAAAQAMGLEPVLLASAFDTPAVTRELAVRGDELKFKGELKGFDVELKLVPKADRLDIELAAARSNVKVQAKGFITRFVQETRLAWEDGEASLVDASVHGLKGEVELTWAAFQSEDPHLDDDIVALELPLRLPIPFMAGPIPMTMSIGTNLRIVPSLTSGGASSGGSWKATYDSDHGFSSNGGSVLPVAQLKDLAADLGSTATVTAGMGPVGFGYGLEFPRLELALGHPLPAEILSSSGAIDDAARDYASFMRPYVFLTLNQYANGMWTPGTTLTAHIPPCQRSSLTVSAIAGYKLSVLGFAELSDTKLLWEKTSDRFKDGKACTLTGG